MTTITAPRPRLMSRTLVLVLAANVGALTSLYLLLSVVPLYAGSVGAGGIGAGLATGALMLSTVFAELVTPRLVAAFGYRRGGGARRGLLGGPAGRWRAPVRHVAVFVGGRLPRLWPPRGTGGGG